ncbi:MAG: hypothetical protein ACOZNI_14455 [Myxococcota bacterium]
MIWLLACGGELPQGTGPEACDREPYPELRTTCLVEAGARLGREKDGAGAQAACDAIPAGAWRDECHFRAGEELGRAGEAPAALTHCGQAGQYATFCVTHAGWGLPPSDTPLDVWLGGVPSLPPELRADATDILRARWWFNRFYGTGAADPRAVEDSPHARGAWALEAIRLADGDVARAKAAWDTGETLVGEPLPPERRVGRYDAPFQIPGETELPRVRTYGSGLRLVGESPAEDLDVALLEALYFRERTDGTAFAAWLADPRPRVRYTALRLFRVLPSPDVEATLTAMREDPDPVVRAHVEDGLAYRTWLGKGHAPGLKKLRKE